MTTPRSIESFVTFMAIWSPLVEKPHSNKRLRAGDDLDLHAESVLGEVPALAGGEQLQGQVGLPPAHGLHPDALAGPPVGDPDGGDPLVVGAVEGDGDAQQAGAAAHQALVTLVEGGELGVLRAGEALAVVPGDEGDQLDLVVGE